MKHKIAFTVDDIKSPVEFEISAETFKKITQTCQDKYPEKNWKTISSSYK